MGITGITHKWFTSYLEGRSQCVDISGNLSNFIELAISVIQGSTLGPLLFLCYINDLWAASSLFSVLFADDTVSLAKGHNLKDLSTYVNEELRKIANWFRANKMALNVSKTKFIVFRTFNKACKSSRLRYLSYIYLGYFVCLCVIVCVCVCVCVCVTIAERTAILLVLIIKLTKEARWMDWRWRY